MNAVDSSTARVANGQGTRVLYAGPFRFPNGDAAAQRVLGIARALRASGLSVELCGWTGADAEDTVGEYDGFNYRNQKEFRSKPEGVSGRVIHHLREGHLTFEWLRRTARKGDVVILYNWYGIYVAKIIAWCRRQGLPVIVDSVEWYDPQQCAGGPFGLVRWEVEWCLRRVFRKADGVIAVSSFLERHFASTTRTIRIPPLIDTSETKWDIAKSPKREADSIQLCYSGFPGRKDNLVNLFSALGRMGDAARKYGIVLVGPNKEHIDRLPGPNMAMRELDIRCLGRVSHFEAIRILGEADYSILIRPDRRFAHAGFSTKFVESLAIGTPPFCNVTSDIGTYTKDGIDSIHLASDSPSDIALGLKRIAQLDDDVRLKMREGARKCARLNFDWHNYVEPLFHFIRKVGSMTSGKSA